MPIFLIAIYAKSEKADMTPAEKRAAAKLVDALHGGICGAPGRRQQLLRSARPRWTEEQ